MHHVKYFIQTLFIAVPLFLLISSKKNDGIGSKDSGRGTPGSAKTVGEGFPQRNVNGESEIIRSADGRLQLIIPEGALPMAVNIRIESIDNTNPAGTGMSYQISPKLVFQKPVTIRFSLPEDSTDFSPCHLAVSFQDTAGKWKMKTLRVLNEADKTVSSEITQTGTWCLMAPVKLVPMESFIQPGQKVKLQVLGFIPVSAEDPCGNWEQPDFSHADVAVSGGTPVLPALIAKWELLATGKGVGNLSISGSTAFYQSSGLDDPAMNPATIAVWLKGASRPLLSRVFVETQKEFMLITINNHTYRYTDVDITADDNELTDKTGRGHFGINWRLMIGERHVGAITWSGSTTGSHAWNEGDNQFWFAPIGFDNDGFVNSFVGDLNQVPSTGAVTIEKFGRVGEFVTGTFIVSNAGRREPDDIYKGFDLVKGRFKIRRNE